MIELNWNSPMCDIPPELRENMNFHATSALRVLSIREFGLLPSVHGAMSSVPALYSSPWRSTCCRSYSTQDVFPTLGKTFVVLFGITGTKAGSFSRKNGNKQVWYAPGMYDVKIIQFLCTQGERDTGVDPTGTLHPGRVRREWERRVRLVEEKHLLHNSWSTALRQRIGDFPYRKKQRSTRGTVKISKDKLKRLQRRLRQRRLRRSSRLATSLSIVLAPHGHQIVLFSGA